MWLPLVWRGWRDQGVVKPSAAGFAGLFQSHCCATVPWRTWPCFLTNEMGREGPMLKAHWKARHVFHWILWRCWRKVCHTYMMCFDSMHSRSFTLPCAIFITLDHLGWKLHQILRYISRQCPSPEYVKKIGSASPSFVMRDCTSSPARCSDYLKEGQLLSVQLKASSSPDAWTGSYRCGSWDLVFVRGFGSLDVRPFIMWKLLKLVHQSRVCREM